MSSSVYEIDENRKITEEKKSTTTEAFRQEPWPISSSVGCTIDYDQSIESTIDRNWIISGADNHYGNDDDNAHKNWLQTKARYAYTELSFSSFNHSKISEFDVNHDYSCTITTKTNQKKEEKSETMLNQSEDTDALPVCAQIGQKDRLLGACLVLLSDHRCIWIAQKTFSVKS